ncbi:GIY-YIG nuclease family protein [Nocardioides lijunqiniae]|uniref:GIY-YIG nuclease family protein n=1 Tax=Nocardioides lijunqiniae TaxID=2760832 RepID=UPI0018785FA2|nr:GIY-YIG nuclease family protein [Nocardioides lijunqiniae]
MAWVYILQCSDGSYYVGSTIDLEGRVSAHNLGLGAAYTSRRRPVRLLWAAEFSRKDDCPEVSRRLLAQPPQPPVARASRVTGRSRRT